MCKFDKCRQLWGRKCCNVTSCGAYLLYEDLKYPIIGDN